MLDRLDRTTDRDFWQQWLQHQEELYRCCLKRMEGNQTDAEDALHEAMLKARDAWHQQTDKIEHVKAWLIKLTNNLCTDILEKRDRRAVGVPDVEIVAPSPEWPRQEDTPVLAATEQELESFFAGAIQELPDRLRETFILYLEKQESYPEVVAELNISYANARKRISQARAILQERYREYRGVPESDPPTTKQFKIQNSKFKIGKVPENKDRRRIRRSNVNARQLIARTSSSVVRYPVAREGLKLISIFPHKKPGIGAGTLDPFVLPWRVWADSGGDGFFSARTRRLSGCDLFSKIWRSQPAGGCKPPRYLAGAR